MAKAVVEPSLDAFSESLRQLQALHQHEVLALLREVAQLRGELGRSRGASSPTDTSAEDSEGGVMKVRGEGMLAMPQAPEAPATLDLPEQELWDVPEMLPKARQRRVSAPGGLPGALARCQRGWRQDTAKGPGGSVTCSSAPEEQKEGHREVVPVAHPPKEVWFNFKEQDVPSLSEKSTQDLLEQQVPKTRDGKLKEDLLHIRAGTKESSKKSESSSERAGTKESSKQSDNSSDKCDRSERSDYPLETSHRSDRRPKTTHSTRTFLGDARSRRAKLFQQYDNFRARNSMGSQSGFRMFWARVVSTPAFDFSMGCVIALNAVAIGVESSIVRAGGDAPVFLGMLDHIFLVIYTAELCARFGAMGRRAIWNPWVQLDALLVVCGLVDVITRIGGVWGSSLADHVNIVRTLRLVRLARMIRLMVKSNTLWMLVQGLLNSLGTLVWTCVILLILLFIFSVLGLELLTPDPDASEEYNRIATYYFGSLLRAMTTLLMGLSLDNFGEVYRPVMLEKPFTAFYFIPFFLLVPVALMNLVTALMVNFSMEQTRKDKDAEEQVLADERAEKVKILEEAFRELDVNHSNRIDLQEMLSAPEELRDLIFDVANIQDARQKDLAYIFNALDFHNRGYVAIHEFCEGLLKLNDPSALSTYAVRYCTSIMLKKQADAN